MGFHLAGFDVYGVDIAPQKHYPFAFHLGDVLEVLAILNAGGAVDFTHRDGTVEWLTLADFAAAHGSPPCQENTRAKTLRGAQGKLLKEHGGNMIPETRIALDMTGLPYVMENVEGSDLVNTVLLCGSMFPELRVTDSTGIRWLQRHRLFESNVWLMAPGSCSHRSAGVRPLGVYYKLGDNVPQGGQTARTLVEASALMGIDWLPFSRLKEAIPPAYTEFIGAQLLSSLESAA